MEFKITVGLGNPGKEYERTYHNAGSLFVAHQLKKEEVHSQGKGNTFLYTKTTSGIFITPTVFMNLSGEAVQEALHYFKLSPADLLVAHDESDLEVGNYKLSFGQGTAGHRGIESVVHHLQTKDFWRLRIGIREFHPNAPRKKAEEFVLNTISSNAMEKLDQVFEGAGGEIKRLMEKDVPLSEGLV